MGKSLEVRALGPFTFASFLASGLASVLALGLASGCSGGSPGPHTGIINLAVSSATLGSTSLKSTSVTASFFDGPGRSDCTTSQLGACTTSVCPSGVSTGGGAGGMPQPDAGSISVAGGSRAVSLSPKADGTYAQTDSTYALWNGGETLTVSGAGGLVPMFSATVTAPALNAQLTAPTAPTPGAALNIARGTDLTLRWTGAGNTTLDLTLGNNPGAGSYSSVTCSFPASAGSATVPAAALATVPAGPGLFVLFITNTTPFAAGGYDIKLKASASPLGSSGLPASYQATFQ